MFVCLFGISAIKICSLFNDRKKFLKQTHTPTRMICVVVPLCLCCPWHNLWSDKVFLMNLSVNGFRILFGYFLCDKCAHTYIPTLTPTITLVSVADSKNFNFFLSSQSKDAAEVSQLAELIFSEPAQFHVVAARNLLCFYDFICTRIQVRSCFTVNFACLERLAKFNSKKVGVNIF